MIRSEASGVHDPSGDSDLRLLRRYFDAGDREAMNELFTRYADTAYRLALADLENAADAEEAVQSAFLYVLQHGDTEIQNVRGWIMRIVISACRDRVKAEARRRERQQAAVAERSFITQPDRDKAELAAAAIEAIKALPKKYRLPVWLHHLEGLTFKEAGEALSLSEDTVAQQASRGIEQVRQALAAAGFAAGAVVIPELLSALPPAPATVTASFKTMLAGGAAKSAAAAGLSGGAKGAGVAAAVSSKTIVSAVLLLTVAAAVTTAFHSGERPRPIQQDEGGGRAGAQPVPAPAPVPAPGPIASGPLYKETPLKELLSKKIDAVYRRDQLNEVLDDLEERVGLHSAFPKPLEKVQFSFEKTNATVKEVLEHLAADGKLDLEYHENTVVFWKRADDKQLADLAELLNAPEAGEHTLEELAKLADPRIYPLIFSAAKDAKLKLMGEINVVLGNGHRDTFRYGKDVSTLVEPILAQMKKPGMKAFWFSTLAATGDKRAEEPLLEGLKDESNDARMAAAEQLGKLGDPKFLPLLVKLLRDPDQNVGISAAWGLAGINDARGMEAVIELAGERDPNLRKRAAYTLSKFKHARAIDTLIALLKDSDKITREDAAAGLAFFRDPRAIDPLAALVKNETEKADSRAASVMFFGVRLERKAAEALGIMHDPRAIQKLIELSRDESAAVRARAAQGLGVSRDALAINALTTLTTDTDSEVRKLSCEALGFSRDPHAVETLTGVIATGDVHARTGAATGLGFTRDPAATAPLLRLADDAELDVRCAAAEGLGLIEDPGAIAKLAAMAKDKNARIRNCADRALCHGSAQFIDALINCLQDPDPEVQKDARKALHFSEDPRAQQIAFEDMFKEAGLDKSAKQKKPEKPPEPPKSGDF